MERYEGLFPNDKRSDFRFESSLAIKLKYSDPVSKRQSWRKGRSVNISKEGLTFITHKPLPKIMEPTLGILLPHPYHAINTKARIVWRNDRKHSYGVKFIGLESDNLTSLEQYLSRTTDSLRIVLDQRILAPAGRHKTKAGKHEIVTFKKASNEEDSREIYSIRKEIFVEGDNYPMQAISSIYDKQAIHFVAIENKRMIGTISVILDGPKGLPLQEFLDISKYRDKKVVEIEKLAVLPHKRKKTITAALMVIAYEFAKLHADRICIFTLEKKRDNISLYEQIGFRTVEKFNFYDVGDALLMILDIEEDSVYETVPEKIKRFRRYVRKLSTVLGLKS